MSSATSIETQTVKRADAPSADPGLRPWQFFVLAGMLSATAVVIVATGQSPASIIILSVTIVATSLVALGVYLALAPLVLPEAAEAPALIAGRTRAALEREKTLVLRSIKELEFDFAMGKISQADFDEMGGRLRARAIGLMQQLDAGGGYKSIIEHELNARMSGKTGKASGVVAGGIAGIAGLKPRATSHATASAEERSAEDHAADEPIVSDGAIVARDFGPVIPTTATATTCASCGGSNDADARFCKHCGTKLSAA